MIALAGAVTVLVTLAILTSGRLSPVATLIIVPLIAAVATGFGVADINKFVVAGFATVSPIVALFIFAILFFSVMTEQGLFDPIVRRVLRFAGSNALLVMVCTVVVAALAHLDGAGATTYIVTISAFIPVYRRLGLSIPDLLLLTGTTAGIMNMEPWAPATVRAASVIKMDPTMLWRPLLPVQAAGLLCMALLAAWRSRAVVNRLAVATADGQVVKAEARRLDWRYAVNAALTIAVLAALLFWTVSSVLVFMVGLAIALPVNYAASQQQMEAIRRHAKEALVLAAVLLSAGVFLGVLGSSGMLDQLSRAIILALPARLAANLHLIVGALATPLGMMFGSDPYYFGILPVILPIAAANGVDPGSVARAMMIGENVGFAISPMVASGYLLVGLGGIEFGAHIRYAFLTTWLVSIVMLATAVLTGAVAI